MRDTTANIEAALTPTASDGGLTLETHVAVDIKLTNGAVLRYATGTIQVTSVNIIGTSLALGVASPLGDVRTYEPRVRRTPDVKFSQGRSPDGGTLAVENQESEFGAVVGAIESFFDGATCVMYECFMKADGTYEADYIFIGGLESPRATPDEVSFTLVSDMSSKHALVAGRALTQKCLAEFEDDRCGHSGAPPGSTCSKIKEDSTGGCRFWAWEHRFFGANFNTLLNPSTVGGSGGSGAHSGGPGADGEPDRRYNGGFPGDGAPRFGREFDRDRVLPF